MSKRKAKAEKEEVVVVAEWDKLTDDQQYDLLEQTISELAVKLELSGADPELVSAALFAGFISRMSDSGDREQYEAILEEALETPWQEHAIH